MQEFRYEDNKYEKMKITHTTYEECRGVTSPSSTSRKVRDFFSSVHSHIKQEKQDQAPSGRPITAWPGSRADRVSPNVVEHFTEKQAIHKQKMRQQKAAATSSHSGRVSNRVEDKELPPLPKLRRKGKFLKEIGGLASTSENSRRKSDAEQKAMEKIKGMYAQQKAIKEGKIEHVALQYGVHRSPPAPPDAEKEWNNPFYLPPSSRRSPHQLNKSSPTPNKLTEYISSGSDILDNTLRDIAKDLIGKKPSHSPQGSRQSSHPRHKSSPTPSKLVGYIGSGSEVLDNTRREIAKDLADKIRPSLERLGSTRRELQKDLANKFKPPFEQLNYHPFSHHRHTSLSSSSDSSYFFCIGESPEPSNDEEATKALKENQNRSNSAQSYDTFGYRLSGEGTNPWIDKAPSHCKLCNKAGLRGIRGLCEICERNFMNPTPESFIKPPSLNKPTSSYEINPIAPLKIIKKEKSPRHEEENSKSIKKNFFEERGVPIKELKLSSTNLGRQQPVMIQSPIPKGRDSIFAAALLEASVDVPFVSMMDQEKGEKNQRILKWASDVQIESPKEVFERWSAVYDDGPLYRGDDDLDEVPLTSDSREGYWREGAEDRGSSSGFEGYWDEVLVGYGFVQERKVEVAGKTRGY